MRRQIIAVATGVAVVGVGSIAIGATAPRWPQRWLGHDWGPLRPLPGDCPERYQRLGAVWFKSFFPELGSAFGGRSKNRLPELDDPAAIHSYIAEARRGELVHWAANLTWLPLPFLQPWWIAGAFAIITGTVNGIAIVILRYNRFRLYGVLAELESGAD